MSKHNLSIVTLLLVVVFCFVALIFGTVPSSTLAEDVVGKTFEEYLTNLVDENYVIYVGFKEPFYEMNGVELPSDIMSDGQKVGTRKISTIGEDYLCLYRISTGNSEFICVPFTNIAFVQHYPVPSP